MAKVLQKHLCLLRRIFPVAIVIAISEVTSFSIGGSAARQRADLSDTDLYDALSLLQRERRRVGGDFVYGERPRYPGADVGGWLEGSRDDIMPVDEYDFGQLFGTDASRQPWVSDGEFKGFDSRPSVVMPSKEEVDDLFSDDDDDDDDNNHNSDMAMKKKGKSVSQKSTKRLVKKSGTSNTKREAAQFDQSFSSSPVSLSLSSSSSSSASPLGSAVEEDNVSLDLTQEEFRALMKAVSKLQKQVKTSPGLAVVEQEVITSKPGEQMAIVQPASKEELASLFATDDDDEEREVTEVSAGSSTILNPENGIVVEEEEETVGTPEGERRVLEVHTPEGGRRVSELVAPDGTKNIVEEAIPEGRVSIKDIEAALEDSEKELSDALASQLEKDISQEVAQEELEAVEEAAEDEAEEAAEFIAAQQQRDKAVSAAKHEIAREIGVENLEALEKMWMADSTNAPNSGMRLAPEKRTTKRAAYKPRPKSPVPVSPRDFSDFELPDIMDDTGFGDLDDDSDTREINREAEEVARELLKEQTLQDAMNAIGNFNSGNEDIIYGSPLTGDEYIADENVSQDRPVSRKSLLSSGGSRQITKERLQELAEKLNLNEERFDDDSSVESFPSDQGEDGEAEELSNAASNAEFSFDDDDTEDDVPELEAAPSFPPPLEQFVARIAELEDKVKQLRLVAGLADFENDVLTDALNEATLAQEPGTVSDLEFNSLQEAIAVERELQKLKQAGALDVDNGDSFELESGWSGDELETKRSERKRGEPWRRKRGKVMSGPNTSTALQLRGSSVQKAHRPKPVSREDVARMLSETQYMQGSPHSIASIFLPDAVECPAVEMYSTNCELADLYSLPVDYEARALCNLHEMCYACGHSLGVSQSTCDEVYRATADTLCEQGQACSLEAEIFLRTMKLKTRYVPHKQPSCRASCTATFLGII